MFVIGSTVCMMLMGFSPPLLADCLRFQKSYLIKASQMPLGSTKLGCQECLNKIPGNFRTDRAPAHAQDVHVVILDALPGGKVIMNQTGTNTSYFVRTNRSTDSAPADCHAPVHIPSRDPLTQRYHIVRIIVIRVQAVSAKIDDLMSRRADPGDQLFLQGKSTVICCNAYSHAASLLRKLSTISMRP